MTTTTDPTMDPNLSTQPVLGRFWAQPHREHHPAFRWPRDD